MSHDYDPCWDYPVIDLDEHTDISKEDIILVKGVIERTRNNLGPQMTFFGESAFEVFFVEEMGLHAAVDSEVFAVYCNGTSSRPVVGFDLYLIQSACEEAGESWLRQFEISLAHELAHAYQESMGAENDDWADEDAAEEFARNWVDFGDVDLSLLQKPLDADMGVVEKLH